MAISAVHLEKVTKAVLDSLTCSGSLDKIKAELRAAAYAAITGQENKDSTTKFRIRQEPAWLKGVDGKLAITLVYDLLAAAGYNHTLAVLEPESGGAPSTETKQDAARQLGLAHGAEPLLVQLCKSRSNAPAQPVQRQPVAAVQAQPAVPVSAPPTKGATPTAVQRSGPAIPAPSTLVPATPAALAASPQALPILKPIRTIAASEQASDGDASFSASVSDSSEGGAKLANLQARQQGNQTVEADATSKLRPVVSNSYEDDFGSVSDEVELVEADEPSSLPATTTASTVLHVSASQPIAAAAAGVPVKASGGQSGASETAHASQRATGLQSMGLDDVLNVVLGSGTQRRQLRGEDDEAAEDRVSEGSSSHSAPTQAASAAGERTSTFPSVGSGFPALHAMRFPPPVPQQQSATSTNASSAQDDEVINDDGADDVLGSILGSMEPNLQATASSQRVHMRPQVAASSSDDDGSDIDGILSSLSGPTASRGSMVTPDPVAPVVATPTSLVDPVSARSPPDTLALLDSAATSQLRTGQGSSTKELASAGANSIRRNPLAHGEDDDDDEQHEVPTWTKRGDQDISPRPDISAWGLPARVPVNAPIDSIPGTKPVSATTNRHDDLLSEGISNINSKSTAHKPMMAEAENEDDTPAWSLPTAFAGVKPSHQAPLPALSPLSAPNGMKDFDISDLLGNNGDDIASDADDDDDLPMPLETASRSTANAALSDVFGDDD